MKTIMLSKGKISFTLLVAGKNNIIGILEVIRYFKYLYLLWVSLRPAETG